MALKLELVVNSQLAEVVTNEFVVMEHRTNDVEQVIAILGYFVTKLLFVIDQGIPRLVLVFMAG